MKLKESMPLLLTLVVAVGVKVTNADFTFDEATNPGPPISTPYDDYNVTLSADGLELYVSADRPGGLGFYDIWRGTRESIDQPWGPLVNVQEINSRYNETFPSLSADGLTLYFSDWYYWNAAGDRPGGVGHHDLWMSVRPSIGDPWEPPVNMGPIINSNSADVSPCVSQDGRILIFASRRPGGLGGNFDLWMSTRPAADSSWAAPVNLGAPVNSSYHDCEECLSPDGLALFFCSDRPGGMGSYDLWLTTRPNIADTWSAPINLGSGINSSGAEGAPSLSPDLRTLYFGSDKPGGTGGWEMYEVPMVPVLDFNGDGMVENSDLLLLIKSWGQDNPLVDIGPAPWGDGIVDEADLEILMSHWGQEIDDPTLAAHWALDEVQGTIAHDGGADRDGVLLGDPTWQPDGGMMGGALALDGIDDYISTDFILNPTDGEFSVLVWVKGGAPGQVILSQKDGVSWLMTDTLDGALRTDLKRPAGTGRNRLQEGPPLISSTVITDGDWHLVVFVRDGTDRILYVDDIEVARDTAESLEASYGGLHIGAGSGLEPGSFFSGLIDDIRIYDRTVSP